MRSSERPTRGVAVLAATFVLTLVGYLFLTAIPAMASGEYDCSVTDAPDGGDHFVITLGTDAKLAFAISNDNFQQPGGNDGDYRVMDLDDPTDGWEKLGDGDCDNFGTPNKFGGEDWLEFHGSNGGAETLEFVQPTGADATENMDTEVFTVDLGSGQDHLIFEYGAFEGDPTQDDMTDPENEDDPTFLTADGPALLQQGTEQVWDFCQDTDGNSVDCDTGDDGDGRIDDPTIDVTVNTGDSTDRIQASDRDIDVRFGPDDTTSADDIPDADGLFDDPLEPDENAVDGDDGACDGKPFNTVMIMNGGVEDDNFESGLANDTINGGPGDDEVDYDGESVNLPTAPFCDGPGPVTVDLAGPVAPPASGGSTGAYGVDVLNDIQDIEGTPHDDTLLGNDLNNDIAGNDGDDVIDGRGGDDGEGDDDIGIEDGLEGDNGDDQVSGSAGNDQVFGDFENEDEGCQNNLEQTAQVSNFSTCNDWVSGGPGTDEVEAGPEDDVVDEGATNSGADDLNGNDGDDVLDYSERTTPTAVRAGGGGCTGENNNAAAETDPNNFDACDATDENDTITFDFEGYRTGSANDVLIGDSSPETYEGGLGDDYIDGSLISGFDDPGWGKCGYDEFFGDCGNNQDLDWAVYSNSPSGITADMVAATAAGTEAGTVTGGSGTDTIVQIEGIVGSDFDDVFNDDPDTDNAYLGNDGTDTFNQPGTKGTDQDLLDGGDGENDLLDYSGRTTDTEGIMEDENDSCFQDSDNPFPDGTFIVACDVSGFEFRNGDTENDETDLWSQDTENIASGSGDDQITGNDTANKFWSNGGDDRIAGAQGTDWFYGGAGDDYYAGGCPWWWEVIECELVPNDGNDVFLTTSATTAAPGDTQGDGADVIFGGTGSDYYDASGRTDDQNLTSEAALNGPDVCSQQDDGVFGEGDSLCDVENIRGGSGNDYIGGDRWSNKLTGGAGNDELQGRGNRDILRGQAGDDRLVGGSGSDRLQGGPGFDVGLGGGGQNVCASIEQYTRCSLG